MASNVELSASTDNASIIQRANTLDTKTAQAELQRIAALAQDPSQDNSAQIKSALGVVQNTVQNLQKNLGNIQSQVRNGGGNSQVKSQWDAHNTALSNLQDGVSKLNNQLAASGSQQRVQWTGNGVQLTNVNSANTPNASSSLSSGGQPWNSGDLTNNQSGPGLQLDQQISPNIKNSPFYGILKQAVTEVVQQLVNNPQALQQAGQQQDPSQSQQAQDPSQSAGSGGGGGGSSAAAQQPQQASQAPASSGGSDASGGASPQSQAQSVGGSGDSSGGSTNPWSGSNYSGLGNGEDAGQGGGEGSGAGLNSGEGSAMFNMFLKALKNAADEKNGTQSNGKGKAKPKAQANGLAGLLGGGTGTGTGGTGATGGTGGGTAAPQAGNAPTGTANTGATPQGTPGNPGSTSPMGGNDNLPISNDGGADAPDDSGSAGDPLQGNANINGLLMMVLLECYQDGQKDLESLAKRLQDVNNQKKGVRATLAQDRSALDGTKPGSQENTQATDKEQNDEDTLNSLGDDSQLEQLDLQNMSQNQQQLLQMISNFSKSTNDNSMAIIRHIGGG